MIISDNQLPMIYCIDMEYIHLPWVYLVFFHPAPVYYMNGTSAHTGVVSPLQSVVLSICHESGCVPSFFFWF